MFCLDLVADRKREIINFNKELQLIAFGFEEEIAAVEEFLSSSFCLLIAGV